MKNTRENFINEEGYVGDGMFFLHKDMTLFIHGDCGRCLFLKAIFGVFSIARKMNRCYARLLEWKAGFVIRKLNCSVNNLLISSIKVLKTLQESIEYVSMNADTEKSSVYLIGRSALVLRSSELSGRDIRTRLFQTPPP